jgi:uncharacterized membrane protein
VIDLDIRLGRILSAGTLTGAVALAIGVLLMMVNGISPLDATYPALDPAGLLGGLIALQPTAWIWLGVVVVIVTPILRVLAALVGFARGGETPMVGVALAILVVVAIGVVVGSAGR